MNKGTKHSEETRKKMHQSAIGRKMPPKTKEHLKKIRESNKKTWSDIKLREQLSQKIKETFSKMDPIKKKKWLEHTREAARRPENRERTRLQTLRFRKDPEFIRKMVEGRQKAFIGEGNPFYGRKHKIETRLKISKNKKESDKTPRGSKNPAWIDGKGAERRGERLTIAQTLEYRLFRETVLKRDNYTCQICGERGGRLHVDHIKSYRKYPELRTDPNNGRVVCFPCHKKTPNYGRKEDYE
jgi:hypothetical protein